VVATVSLLLAGTSGVQLPVWVWVLGIAFTAVGVLEEQQRAARKAKHRAYLKSRGWKARRREALTRAGGCCADCGSPDKLHVHHLTYKRHGSEEQRDLRVLCSRCHVRRHRESGRMDDHVDRFIAWIRASL
jgi:5-methylcytosine-specific restriction endonuclease McrA